MAPSELCSRLRVQGQLSIAMRSGTSIAFPVFRLLCHRAVSLALPIVRPTEALVQEMLCALVNCTWFSSVPSQATEKHVFPVALAHGQVDVHTVPCRKIVSISSYPAIPLDSIASPRSILTSVRGE